MLLSHNHRSVYEHTLKNIWDIPIEPERRQLETGEKWSVEKRDSRVRHQLLVPRPVVSVLARTLGLIARVAVQQHRRVKDGVVVRDDGALAGRGTPDDGLDPVRDVVCAGGSCTDQQLLDIVVAPGPRPRRGLDRFDRKADSLGLRRYAQNPSSNSSPRLVLSVLGFSSSAHGNCGNVYRLM